MPGPDFESRRRLLKIGGLSLLTSACAAGDRAFTPVVTIYAKAKETVDGGYIPPSDTAKSTDAPKSTEVPATEAPATEAPEPKPTVQASDVIRAKGGYVELSPAEQKEFDRQSAIIEPWLSWWATPESNPKSDPSKNFPEEEKGRYISGVNISQLSWRGIVIKFIEGQLYVEIDDPVSEQNGAVIMPRSSSAETYTPAEFPSQPKAYDGNLTPVYMVPRKGETIQWDPKSETFVSVSSDNQRVTRRIIPATMTWENVRVSVEIEVDEKGKPIYSEAQKDLLTTPVVHMNPEQFASLEKMIRNYRDKMLSHLEAKTGIKAVRESEETVTFTEYIKYINNPQVRETLGMREFLDYWMDIPVIPSELAIMNAEMIGKGNYILHTGVEPTDRVSIPMPARENRWVSSLPYWYDNNLNEKVNPPVVFPDGTEVPFYSPYIVEGNLGGLFKVPGLSKEVGAGLTGGIVTNKAGEPYWAGLCADGATYTKMMFYYKAGALSPELGQQLVDQMLMPEPDYGPSYARFGYLDDEGKRVVVKRQQANSFSFPIEFRNTLLRIGSYRDIGICWEGPGTAPYRLKGANGALVINAAGNLYIPITK